MSLYGDWQEEVLRPGTGAGAPALRGSSGRNTFAAETENYKKDTRRLYQYGRGQAFRSCTRNSTSDEVTFVGFLDGINSSLKKEIKLDSLKSGSKVDFGYRL